MKVGIQNKEGRIILVWNDGKRRTMALGMPDTPPARALAEKTKAEIEWDWHIKQYDPTLLKYRPRTGGKNPSEISTIELFDRFTKHQQKSKGLAQSSIDTRYGAVKRMLEKYLDMTAVEVDRRRVEAFADVCDEELSPAIAKARIWLLRAAWAWGMKNSLCHLPTTNPWDGIAERWYRSQPPKSPPALTRAEVTKIIAGFQSSPYYSHYADYVFFQLNMGTRPGEASGLKWSSVSADFARVWVGESYYRGIQGPTKNRKARSVDVVVSVSAMLRARWERLKPQPDDYVFTAKEGGPVSDRNFRSRAWTKVLADLGIPYRKPYVTRKTNISHSLKAGANYIDVAAAVGHDPHTMHKFYAESIKPGAVLFDFGNAVNPGGGDYE